MQIITLNRQNLAFICEIWCCFSPFCDKRDGAAALP